jgi:hypothetical protein
MEVMAAGQRHNHLWPAQLALTYGADDTAGGTTAAAAAGKGAVSIMLAETTPPSPGCPARTDIQADDTAD